jgi:HK97 family phage prohead protease
MNVNHMACSLREIKVASDEMTFEGYGAVFGNVDSYGDVIAPGAFASFLSDVKSGKQNWPAMLSQHGGMGLSSDDMTPVGVWVDLVEDGHGLKVTGKLADTPRGRELHQLMKMEPRPAIDGLSIGYIAKEWEPRSKPEDPRRTLKRIDLMEISPVTFPANGKARVASVKAFEELTKLSEIEDFLREAGGFSRNEAKAIIARIKSANSVEADDLTQITAALTKRLDAFK